MSKPRRAILRTPSLRGAMKKMELHLGPWGQCSGQWEPFSKGHTLEGAPAGWTISKELLDTFLSSMAPLLMQEDAGALGGTSHALRCSRCKTRAVEVFWLEHGEQHPGPFCSVCAGVILKSLSGEGPEENHVLYAFRTMDLGMVLDRIQAFVNQSAAAVKTPEDIDIDNLF